MSQTNAIYHLKETVPPSVVAASWKNFIVAAGAPTALFCLSGSIYVLLESGWISFVASLTFWLFPAGLVFGLATALHRRLVTHVPTVELSNDQLRVRYGERTLIANIKRCHVHRGRAFKMRLPGGVKLYCWQRVILIDLPPFWNSRLGMRYQPRSTVAVGFSNALYDRWERDLLAIQS